MTSKPGGPSDRRIDRPPLLASCPVGGHVALRADGVSGQGATYCGQVSGTGSIAPPGRNRCGASAAASTVLSAGRSAGGYRPVRPRCGQRVSATRAAMPVGIRTRAARRPSATAALRRRCPPRCPPAGRLTGKRTQTMTVPAPRTSGAVGVRPPWPPRRWGRTAAEPALRGSRRQRETLVTSEREPSS
jgi:hypothetical protein